MPIDTVIKISGTIPAASTTDAIASIDIPEDGEIVCVGGLITGIYSPTPAALANTSLVLAGELSFMSTNQIAANDARGSIGGIGCAAAMVYGEAAETGGGGFKLSEQGNICIEGGGLSINAGERVYIHGFSSIADLTATLTFLMYIKNRGGGRRAIKRR